MTSVRPPDPNPPSPGAPVPSTEESGQGSVAVTPKSSASLSDIHGKTRITDTHRVTKFDPAIKIKIGGKNFSITFKRPRVKTPVEYSAPKYVNDPDSFSGTDTIAKLPGGKKFLSGYSKTGHWLRKNQATRGIYNTANRKFGFTDDYHELSEEEEEKISQKMDEAWTKYSKEYVKKNKVKLDIDDVLGLRLEMNTKEKEFDFDKPFYFYIFVKKRDKEGNILKYKDGDFKFEIIHLHSGKVAKGDVLGLAATAIDLTIDRKIYQTFEKYFEARDIGFKEVSDIEEDTSEEGIDKNICYLHSMLNFAKGLKSKEEQKTEFNKPKSDMDRDAMALKDKMGIAGTDEEDVHEKLLASGLIKNPESFSTRKLKYYDNPSWLTCWLNPYELAGMPEESQEPIPSLSITDKKDLQDSLDKHHLNTDATKCGILK
nr:hypothetical protein [Candidatus Anoxychlamydiales bacterium]